MFSFNFTLYFVIFEATLGVHFMSYTCCIHGQNYTQLSLCSLYCGGGGGYLSYNSIIYLKKKIVCNENLNCIGIGMQ